MDETNMTSLVQVASTSLQVNVASITVTLTATIPGNSLIAVYLGYGTAISAATWGFSNGGAGLTWTTRYAPGITIGPAGIILADSLNAPTSTTSVTLTATDGNRLYGTLLVCEVTGGAAGRLDGTIGTLFTSSYITTGTVTGYSSAGTNDFTIAACCLNTGTGTANLSDPPSGGNPRYTSLYYSDVGAANGNAAEVAYCIQSAAIALPTATWANTVFANYAAVIASYAFTPPLLPYFVGYDVEM